MGSHENRWFWGNNPTAESKNGRERDLVELPGTEVYIACPWADGKAKRPALPDEVEVVTLISVFEAFDIATKPIIPNLFICPSSLLVKNNKRLTN